MMQTVWCLEDESSVRELELYTLCSAGFDAAGFECAEELFVALREKHPDLLIELDGGVNLNNAAALKEAGVDVFVAGNAVFSAEDMAERVREFQRILK